jgi:hypothetical protein
MVRHGQNHDLPIPVPSKPTRRAVVGWTAKLAAGALVTTIPVGRLVETARAQDDEVILIAGGAQVSARPGSATARSVNRIERGTRFGLEDPDQQDDHNDHQQ